MNRKLWAPILGLIAVSGAFSAYSLLGSASSGVPVYAYEIVETYPHDSGAFTQGLAFVDNTMYEGTGMRGSSSLRRVDLETGGVLQRHDLSADYFGEGITVLGDRIIQLTWTSGVGFVYDRDNFDLLREFSYPTEGWGLTHDGVRAAYS